MTNTVSSNIRLDRDWDAETTLDNISGKSAFLFTAAGKFPGDSTCFLKIRSKSRDEARDDRFKWVTF